MRRLVLILAAITMLLGVVPAVAQGTAGQEQTQVDSAGLHRMCASLVGSYVDGVHVTATTWISADGATLPTDVCQVLGTRAPFLDIEVDLPATWAGRLVQIGDAGFGGTISPGVTLDSAGHPTAVSPVITTAHAIYAASNGGSRASVPSESEPIVSFSGSTAGLLAGIDFEYQSVGTTLFFAKDLAARFFRQRPRYTYLIGCSQGGHDADMAMERWGNQYSGVVKGCWSMDNVATVSASVAIARQSSAAGISSAQGTAAYDAAIAQCDAMDGLRDGVIADPQDCRFDPAQLECGAPTANPDPTLCLTADQVQYVRSRLSDITLPDGSLVYSGYTWTNFAYQPSSASALHLYLISADKGWTDGSRAASFELDTEYPTLLAQAQQEDMTENLSAIASYVASGGKLLSWNDGADNLVSEPDDARNTADVASLAKGLGLADPSQDVRYFVVPGGQHGDGASLSQVDWLTSIINWTEHGKAPDQLTYTRTLTGASQATSIPVCDYPKYPRYRGVGDPGSASSFVCAPSQQS
jgi:feruloyl esterase